MGLGPSGRHAYHVVWQNLKSSRSAKEGRPVSSCFWVAILSTTDVRQGLKDSTSPKYFNMQIMKVFAFDPQNVDDLNVLQNAAFSL